MLLALAHSVATEVRPKDLQKSVYQCRVMGNRGSGKASGTTGGGSVCVCVRVCVCVISLLVSEHL